MKSYDAIDIIDIFLYGLQYSEYIPELKKQWIVVYMDTKVSGNILTNDMTNFFKESFEKIKGHVGHYCSDYICEFLPFERILAHSFYLTDRIDYIRDLNVYTDYT